MAIGYSTTVRSARLTALVSAAGSGAKLKLYAGTRPATGGTATTLLATFTCAATLGVVASGVLTFNSIAAATAAAGGGAPGTNASWARLETSGGTFLADFTVTQTGGGGDLTMDSTAVQTGATLTPGTITIVDGNP